MARSRSSAEQAIRDRLQAALARLEPGPDHPVLIAFSGGLDSTVLLEACVDLLGANPVFAAHVHHGLQPAADGWARHCEQVADRLGIRFAALTLDARPAGVNTESWAREGRYRLLCEQARRIDAVALLTAHHADDQLETVLMAWARGSGLDGLCGIAPERVKDGVRLLRPLLDLSRATLHEAAQQARLHWVEDPSNADTRLRRNAVRHRLVRKLDEVMPDFRARLPDTLEQLREARELIHRQAAADLRAARCAPAGARTLNPQVVNRQLLNRRALAQLPPPRIAAALRAWLHELGCRMPSRARLAVMQAQLIEGGNPQALLQHDGWSLRRYRDVLHAVSAYDNPVLTERAIDPTPMLEQASGLIDLHGAGQLAWRRVEQGISPDWLACEGLHLRSGQAQDRLRPGVGGPSRTLKNLWQEAGIVPWLRHALPVLDVKGRVLMAAPFGMDQSEHWPQARPGITLQWSLTGPGLHPAFACLSVSGLAGGPERADRFVFGVQQGDQRVEP